MSDTNEAVFDFSSVQRELDTKKAAKILKKQANIDATYLRNRSKMLAKSKAETKAHRADERMKNSWQHNFDQLPPEEQQRINEASLDARVALALSVETIGAVAKGKTSVVPPDEIYRFVADFVARTGRGEAFSDLSLLASLDAETFEAATADDLNIRLYGRPTKLNGLIFDILADSVWQWAQTNPCDPDVYAELKAKFFKEPLPVPAQIIGLKMATKSEETARETTQEFVKTQQRIMERQ